jgi:streptogramin lyase
VTTARREPTPSRSARRLAVAVVLGSLALGASASAAVKEFPVSDEPFAITAGPDGNLWFTEPLTKNHRVSTSHRIGKITTSGKVMYYSAGISGTPGDIAAGRDGNLWFIDPLSETNNAQDVAKITPSGGVTEFPMAAADGSGIFVHSLIAGPDGNMWFTGIQKQCTRTGTPSEPPPPPPPPSGPTAVTAIVTEYCGQFRRIGKITPAGVVTDYTGPEVFPGDITTGPHGNLWFIQGSPAEQEGIGKITPSGAVTEYSLGGRGRAIDITAGPDGNLWFTQNEANRIGKITTTGAITYYSVGKSHYELAAIAVGPDGNLWFSGASMRHRIGRITTSGEVTYYTAGISGTPGAIATGRDGNLWFTETEPNRIARFSIPGHKSGKKRH